eukprot:5243671-Pleurochrysis_carterae.AAC.1
MAGARREVSIRIDGDARRVQRGVPDARWAHADARWLCGASTRGGHRDMLARCDRGNLKMVSFHLGRARARPIKELGQRMIKRTLLEYRRYIV